MQHVLRAHIENVVSITDSEFTDIISYFERKKFKKHQFLVQEGEFAKYHYFVISGLLKLVYTDDSGKEHIVAFAMEDWWESDFSAFFNQAKATMSLECVEDTEVFYLSLADYHEICRRFPKMQQFFLEKANRGYLGLQQRIISWLTSDAKERYEQLILRYPSLLQRVPKSLLASYLGVSRETLSRFYS